MGVLRFYFRSVFLFLTFIFVCTNTYAESSGNDSLFYFGHSFVQIKTSEGVNIYIDPYNINEFRDSADIVLITHEHYDHNELARVKQKTSCQVIRSANAIQSGVYQSFTIGNVKITAVAAYNIYHSKNACVGYVVEFDGIKLYHSGDTGKITEMADLANLNLDYALLCMDGVYTMNPEEATLVAAMINAKHDIPIHTMPPTDTYSDAIVARFTSPNKLIVKPATAIKLAGSTTAAEKNHSVPKEFQLNQNYPNPFNPSTTISYSITASAHVELKVYNMLGQEITTLIDQGQNAGNYNVKFTANLLASGIYLYKLSVSGKSNYSSVVKKMILLK
jgi:L-ascorbate metabolism protein UlaG (beta-lactamase superfamily)